MYQKSDCFVNPSFYEGMPNAVLEAMACGLPIVASDIPGNDAVVRHNDTGILFDLAKPGALREALATLAQDRAAANLMGQRGRVQAEQNFSWVNVAAQYAELFQEVTSAS
jgi:glycosyltransferase involved in cell wall biosynthesis